MAAYTSSGFLTFSDFIKENKIDVDYITFDRFWNSDENSLMYIDDALLEWIKYPNFTDLLANYTQDKDYFIYTTLPADSRIYPKINQLESDRYLFVTKEVLRRLMWQINTPRSLEIRRYYDSIIMVFMDYCKYVNTFIDT